MPAPGKTTTIDMRDSSNSRKRYKLAVFAPNLSPGVPSLLRKISNAVDLKVFVLSDYGIVFTKHKEFSGEIIKWDDDFLQGYSYELLRNYGPGVTGGFLGLINPSVVSKVLSGDFDAVIVSGYARLSSWLVVVTSWLKGIPVLFIGESTSTEETGKSKLNRFVKAILLGKVFFKMVSRFLCLGTDNKKFYELYGISNSRMFFSPYTVDDEMFVKKAEELKSQRTDLRKNFGIRDDEFVIIFSGKLLPRKDPLTLVKAYEMLHRELSVSLIFIGEGELRGEIEDYVKKKAVKGVKLVGFQNYKKIFEYYAIADLLVMPSVRDPWATVISEVMYFGIPVIASDAIGSRLDWVRDNGFVFHVGDANDLSQKIEFLVKNREVAKKFGKRSREIIAGFTQDKRVEGIISALDSLNRR